MSEEVSRATLGRWWPQKAMDLDPRNPSTRFKPIARTARNPTLRPLRFREKSWPLTTGRATLRRFPSIGNLGKNALGFSEPLTTPPQM